ncbi:ABC transporter substrate-binding protein [Paenirhodobacter sp.]|uniref:ABC transporter substrate-binding protein n=1 Tax=Paenirhodobacter sp. TaxID=1965326 RepID=UPI003B3DF379
MRRRPLMGIILAAFAGVALPASAQQTVRVGSSPTGLPFSFINTETRALDGVMVDIVKAIGKEMGFEPDFEAIQFSALIPSLTSDKIDLIAAAMFITDKRREVIDFSAPVYGYGEGLFVPATDGTAYKSHEDLKDKTVGVQVGTTFVDAFQQSGLFKDVKIYKTIPDIIADVNAGRIDAGFADGPIVAYYLQQGRFPKVRLVESYEPSVTGEVGIGIRKGDARLDQINATIAKMKADGTLDAIFAKYGLK